MVPVWYMMTHLGSQRWPKVTGLAKGSLQAGNEPPAHRLTRASRSPLPQLHLARALLPASSPLALGSLS